MPTRKAVCFLVAIDSVRLALSLGFFSLAECSWYFVSIPITVLVPVWIAEPECDIEGGAVPRVLRAPPRG